MSIQTAIQNVLDNATDGSYDAVNVKVDSYGVSIESFTYSYGSIDDVEANTDDCDIEIDINGRDPDSYYFVDREAIDALAELDLSTIVEADQADPGDVVSIDSVQHVLRDMVMHKRDFAGVWEVIERAQVRDSELASEAVTAEAIESDIEASESESDSE